MAMENLGGNLPAGRPAAVFAGGKTHVFAVGAGGVLNHWFSANGLDWDGPTAVPRLTTNLVPCYPCAIALGNAIHVFTINNGGALVRWSSPDGVVFNPTVVDSPWPIPGGISGIAACSPNANRIDAFAVTSSGLVRYSWDATLTSLGAAPLPPNLLPGNLPPCVPAAVSSAPNVTDVFAVSNDGRAIRWRSTDGLTWAPSVISPPAGPFVRSGLAAVSPASGRIELFAITTGAQGAHWSMDGANVTTADFLPFTPMPINDGVPVAIVVRDRVEVFAIGNPLVRWHRRDGGPWSDAKLIDANLPAGGLAASVTSDSRIDVFGLGAGGLQHWPAGIGAADRKSWVNWGGNQRTQPEGICSPVSLEELVAIARSATRANKRVRAVGSSWSLSDVAVTDGFVVETSKLDRLLDTVVPHALIDSPRSIIQGRRPFILKPNQLVHVEAGIQVEQLMLALDGKQLAPGTMGGSSGQTLAGVLSTSVHGSHFRLPPFPDWVRALHLVGPDGTQYWIEPADNPITKDAELRQALGPGVAVVRDNNWYNATIASVGSLGIVYSVILEVREAYKMTVNRSRDTWSKIRPRLADGSLFTEGGPDSVYVSIDPGTSMATGDPDCYVTSRVNVSKDVPSKPASTDTMSEGLAAFCNNHQLLPITYAVAAATPAIYGSVLGALAAVPGIELASPVLVPLVAALTPVVATADLAVPILISILKTAGPGAVGDFVGVLLDKHPSETAAVISSLTRSQQPLGPNIVVDDAHRVMAPWDSTECVARGLALEIALDATAGGHIRYVDAVIAALRDEAQMGRFLGGWISVRFVGMSRAFLSPHKSAMTCTVEYTGLRTLSSTKPLLLKLEALGRDHGAIQHWGMFLDLNPGDVESAYPHLDTWRRVRWELTRGGTITTFDSNFTRRCGLSDPPNPLPGLGKDIGVGADGSVWMIGTNPVGAASDFGVYKWNGTNWDGVDGGGVRIAVGPDGTPWMVNSVGQIFHRQGNSWGAPLPGLGKDIGVGADGSVWMIGTNRVGAASDFGVYKWNGTNWDGVDGGGVRIAVGPDGTPWMVNSAGQIFHRQGNSWKAPLPGLGKDIGVGADASVWMIGTNPVGTASDFGVYKRNGMNWDGLANSGGVSIAVDPRGRAWLVNSAGQIFRRS